MNVNHMRSVWREVRQQGAEEQFLAALKQRVSSELGNIKTPEDAFKLALQYQLIDHLPSLINEVLNLDEGNATS